LALLEHSIADTSHSGEQGIVHSTRDVVAILSSNSQMLFHNKIKDHLQTMGGTPVITGSGYSGDSPRISVTSAQVTGTTVLTITPSVPHGLAASDTIQVRYSFTGGAQVGTRTSTLATATYASATTLTVVIAGGTAGSLETVAAGGYIQYVASNNKKWIYATGTVKVYLGDVDVVNDNLGQAYDVTGKQNDIRLKAIRPAAVYFDTSIHLAVPVDLTL
jgi:hypothetical protein